MTEKQRIINADEAVQKQFGKARLIINEEIIIAEIKKDPFLTIDSRDSIKEWRKQLRTIPIEQLRKIEQQNLAGELFTPLGPAENDIIQARFLEEFFKKIG